MQDNSIYQAPQSAIGVNHPVLKEGEHLKVLTLSTLPKICVKCGSAQLPEEENKKLTYVHPLHFLWILLGPLFLIIAYVIVKKTLDVTFYRCKDCSDKARRWKMGALFFGLLFVAMIVVRATVGKDYLVAQITVLIASFILMLFCIAMKNVRLSVKSYQAPYFTLKGFHKKLLENVES